MKCIVLAGGAGDRLWPLSRKNYPKQFLNIKHNNSLFQETITRNLPFCDEFIIVSNNSYKPIIESQMKQFQAVSCRIVYEEKGKGTAFALALASHMLGEKEEIMLLPSDLYLCGDGYSDAIYEAKTLAQKGEVVLFGIRPDKPNTAFGYIRTHGQRVVRFIEKPSKELAEKIFADDSTYWNSGMLLTRNDLLQRELDKYLPAFEEWFRSVTLSEKGNIEIKANSVENLHKVSIEKGLLERCKHVAMVLLQCDWKDVGNFQVYQSIKEGEERQKIVSDSCTDVTVINDTEHQLVVANGLTDTIIVNTDDAVYVSDSKQVNEIKKIIARESCKFPSYFEESVTVYRQWGYREKILVGKNYRIRKVTIYVGESISSHMHNKRTETYSVVEGLLSADIDGEKRKLGAGECIVIHPGQTHRLYNESDDDVTMLEIDIGAEIDESDMQHRDEIGGETLDDQTLPSFFRLEPAFKDYLWGGHRLVDLFRKNSPYEVTAESWELSAHPAGQSKILEGPLDGMYFGDFVARYGRQVCGWKSVSFDRFPILIKFIDAYKQLSVQVHPFDDYAFVREKEFGKNEFWYVMDAAPGAFLYCGFCRQVNREEIERRIKENTIEEVLNKVPVSRGDCVFIPAGTIHAIGEGLLICEIQQNSNSTYRVYDYNRRDAYGKLREMHIAKALDVMDFGPYKKGEYGFEKPKIQKMPDAVFVTQLLCQCKYFQCVKYTVHDKALIYMDDASFVSLIFLSGNGKISCGKEELSIKAGDSIFVSSGRKVVHVFGECEFIETKI